MSKYPTTVTFTLHGHVIEIPYVIVKGMRHGQMLQQHVDEEELRHLLDRAVWTSCRAMVPSPAALESALEDNLHGQRILVLAAALMAKGQRCHPAEAATSEMKKEH